MRKGIATIAVLAIIAIVAIMLYAGSNIQKLNLGAMFAGDMSSIKVGECSLQTSNGLVMLPLFGYFACEPIDSPGSPRTNTLLSGFYNPADPNNQYFTEGYGSGSTKNIIKTFRCPNENALTKQCSLTLKGLPGGLFNMFGGGSVTVCMCDTSSQSTCHGCASYSVGQNEIKTITTNMQPGTYVGLQYPQNYIELTMSYYRYGLKQYEGGSAPKLLSSSNCVIDPKYDQCQNCGTTDPKTGQTIYNNPSGSLKPDEYSTYRYSWYLSPYQAVVTKDGKICSGRVLYDLKAIQLESGCYLYPYSVYRSLNSDECCPGEIIGNQYCGDDLHWHLGDIGCIRNGIPSVVNCDGGGAWVVVDVKLKDVTIKRATSCSSSGQCIYETRHVECFENQGCPQGSSCVYSFGDMTSGKCQGGIVPCGDRNNDCYDDCTNERIQGCVISETCASVGQSTITSMKPCCPGLVENNQHMCEKPTSDWLKILIGAVTIAFIIIAILFVASLFIPQLAVIRNINYLFAIFIIIVILVILLALPSALKVASVVM